MKYVRNIMLFGMGILTALFGVAQLFAENILIKGFLIIATIVIAGLSVYTITNLHEESNEQS